MISRIPYTKPSITDLEAGYALDAARNGWGDACYAYIGRFEAAFAAHLGVQYAIATSSCTGALHMGLAALGIGAGDEVIIADTNWVASVAPVCYLNATPVFVDIDPSTWCIDTDAVARAITPHTKAIIAVHLYGNPADVPALQALADLHGLQLIEDAAEAIGTMINGHRAGSMGRFGVFSFHGTKTLTTGEGGMFVTSDSSLYEKVLTLSNHGRARGQTRQFWPDTLGFKYKMSNIQAAIGCGQVERIDDLIARKRAIFDGYRHRIGGHPGVNLNPEPMGTVNGAWMPTVVFAPETGITREMLQAAFAAEKIDARPFFWPLSSLEIFDDCSYNKHSWDIPGRAINLPSFHDITENELDRVTAIIHALKYR